MAEATQQPETAVSPVAMSRLDNKLIADLEVLLFAEGFKQAKKNAWEEACGSILYVKVSLKNACLYCSVVSEE